MNSPDKPRRFDLIAIDCDGTLLDSRKTIPAGTKEAITEVKARGIEIVITTGRNLKFLRPIIEDLNLSGPIIGCGGAFGFDIKTGSTLFQYILPIQKVEELIRLCRELKITLFVEDMRVTYFEFLSGELHFRARQINSLCVRVPDLLQISWEKSMLKAMVLGDQNRLDEIYQIIKDRQIFDNLVFSDHFAFDILPSGVNKGTALKSIANILEIPRKRIATVGDWWNDLDMFKESGMAVAMGNALPEVKEAADLVAPSNDQNGLIWALEKLLEME